jgi:hypothetical protein
MTNMISAQKSTAPYLVAEERVLVEGLQVHYQLYRRFNGDYVMRVSDGKDSRAASLGSRFNVAARFFLAVTAGFVTPCTFYDILDDENNEGFFQKISLQNNSFVL